MILVMVGALNVILLALQQQNKVTQSLIEKSNSNLGKLNEEIKISEIRVTALNKLNMTVTNSGGSTAKLASLYVVNETASPKTQYRFDLNSVPIDGRASLPQIGQNLALTLQTNTKYSVKVVTTAGNSATSGIRPISSAALPMSLTVIPPTVPPGQNVTLLMTVTNNITDSALGWPVTPTISYSGCSSPCVLTPYGSSPAATVISQGNTALFKWTYKVETSTLDNTQITFNASLTNAKPGNFVREIALVKIIQMSETTIIVNEQLVTRPELFIIMPGPYGEATGTAALWGVVVVNPTNIPLDINRLWIAPYTSTQSGAQIFFRSSPSPTCAGASYIYPTTNWSCPHDNLIMWVNTASPVVVPGYGAVSFLTRQEPGSLNQGDEPGFNINFGVYSSLGQFAKTGLSTSMSSANEPLANVYLTDTTTPATAITCTSANNHCLGQQLALPDNSNQTFRIAFADFDSQTSTTIVSGSKLVINVPPKFSQVTVDCASSTGFSCGAGQPTIIGPFSDDSYQIVALTNGILGGVATGSPGAKILTFTAKTPDITGTKVYIMHVLADGETNTGWSVSPYGQIAIQVIGT